MKQVIQKRPFTLIEALIAMLLTALLLTTLLFFYRQMSTLDAEIEKATKESFSWRLLENRLAAVLPATSKKKRGSDSVFLTAPVSFPYGKEGTDSLIFTYNNGVDLDKKLANQVLGRLFLDPEGQLVLATWPRPLTADKTLQGHPKREILMDGVESLSFEFFVPPREEGVADRPEEHWKSDWRATEEKLPAIVKITLRLKRDRHPEKTTYTVAFPLPNAGQPPIIR